MELNLIWTLKSLNRQIVTMLTLQSHNYWLRESNIFGRRDDSVCNDIAAHDAAEDVYKDRAHAGVIIKNFKGLDKVRTCAC